MFTGIVRERGRVVATGGDGASLHVEVEAPQTAREARRGDSISVNGVCVTAVDVRDGVLGFDVVQETLERTSLGRLGYGTQVNVEPAARVGEPLGGHYVQGHVDAVGRVRSVEQDGEEREDRTLWIEAPPNVFRYCVEKGSITVDGVALTIAELGVGAFRVALIPHTLAETTLGGVAPGDEVNLEADVLAKYVERLLERRGS